MQARQGTSSSVVGGIGCGLVLVFGFPIAGWSESFECLIEPNQVVEIRSAAEGIIERVNVQRGDRVKVGETLVQLESSVEKSAADMARYRSQMEGRIASSKNRLEFATKKLNRAQELQKQNFVSAQAADEAEAEKKIAEGELKDAIENQELAKRDYQHAIDILSLRTLRSPLNGVVVDRMLNPGDLAESGTGRKPILKIAQIDPLLVEVALPLEAYGKLRVGMSGIVTPEGLKGHYSAVITVVDSVVDAASGMFGVRLEMKNRKASVPGGIRCKVEFPSLKTMAPKAAKLN
ncbi:MAG TPA: efflux RND transporter periplasmic adaptor subunit [Gallionella sp.]|nr:efflux RND transporter periplasmic adaptor subunit [Gallionella sp.]